MSDWIRVADRLPDEGDTVLIYGPCWWNDDRRMVCVAEYRALNQFDTQAHWSAIGSDGYECEDMIREPTHWMPLPPLPDEEPVKVLD